MLRPSTILAAACLLGGCPANNGGDSAMVVLGNVMVPAGTVCTLTVSMSGPFISHGVMNIASPNPYLLNPLIESEITATTMSQTLQRTIVLQGADVNVSVASATVGGTPTTITLTGADANFKSLFSGTLGPNPSLTAVGMDLIPVSTLNSILQQASPGTKSFSAEVVATVTIFGLLGGDRVQGVPFQYPVTLCNDCVLNDKGPCPQTATNLGNACNPYQDGIIDCCEGSGGLVCPAH